MTIAPNKNLSQEKHPWYSIEHFIAGLDADSTVKYFLTLVHLHTNFRNGYAWTEQKKLAVEMGCSLSTVERAVRWSKKHGVVHFRRVRTGKGKADQFNQYWLDIDRLNQLQRPAKHPSPMTGAHDAANHEAPVKSAPEHPSILVRAPVMGDGIGFQVIQDYKVGQVIKQIAPDKQHRAALGRASIPNSARLHALAMRELRAALDAEKRTGKPFPLAPIAEAVARKAGELAICFDRSKLESAFRSAMRFCKVQELPIRTAK
jgi:hypothetical protein